MQYGRSYIPRGRRPDDGSLRQYRLYFLGGDKHINYSHEFEAENDAKAIGIAESWLEGRPAELWAGTRRVKTWNGETRRSY